MIVIVQRDYCGIINNNTDPYGIYAKKYMIYSAHDWTVSQVVQFMNATNGNWTVMPYASTYLIELHYDGSSYSVEIWFNGVA